MQQNTNPSAPPEEADDFQWIENSIKNQPGTNIHHSQPQGFIQPNDMPIPDAIQQQIIYQRIMEQQKQKPQNPPKQPSKPEQKQPIIVNEYKQSPSQPKPSFMSQDIVYPESSLYKTAGIAVWRPKPNGKGIQFMMGLEKKSTALSFFGGARDQNDKSCADTAIREFHEETGQKLDGDTLGQIRRMLLTDKDRCVFWKKEWNSVLYYYQMGYDYDIVRDYPKNKTWNAEIKSIHWIDFEKIYRSVFMTGNVIKISKNTRYALRSFVVGMVLHKENRKYLTDLHLKNGGNINRLKPSNNGSIRSTLDTFTHIPKIIRLNIVSPMTYNVLFNRWIECDISDIEDYQLLVSLITSIVPEIGKNFVLYYTDNKSFKTSKAQYVIDTIPSFSNLQTKLKGKSKQFVTQISIVPTFIVSDNLKGISLSFKKKEVMWKGINASNDDEKGLGNIVYDKASQWAHAWFGEESDEDSDDGTWKWQFMNDKNKFEDLTDKNSKLLELSFMSGSSFTNFKRKSVHYQANFKTMCQKNLNTKNIRAIRRVPTHVKGDKPSPMIKNSYNYVSPVLQYYKWQYEEDNHSWTDYATEVSKQLNTFKSSADSNNSYYGYNWHNKYDQRYTYSTQIKNKNNSQSYNYQIDIKHLKQRNVSTQKERSIRQIPVYNSQNNNNNSLDFYQNKWQFREEGYNKWSDFDASVSRYMEGQYSHNRYSAFTVNTNHKTYKIHFRSMQQQCLSSGKFRTIRRQAINFGNVQNSPIKHTWQWLDDDGTYKKYDKNTSNQIENACNSGIKKYFFASSKNSNSYEISFGAMSQCNVQSGKQRKVRKVRLEPLWKGAGPNPKKWRGPITANNRRTFDKKVCDLYMSVGDSIASEVKRSGKVMYGSLGPFGCGLYVYDNVGMCKQMAKDRSASNKGNIIKMRVFVGKECDVSTMDDKEFDFMTLQKNGFDSISRSLGFGKEYIVYNMDQLCVVTCDKYYN